MFFSSRQGQGISVFSKASMRVAYPIQPPVERLPQDISVETKRPEREADHSPLLVPRLRIVGAVLDVTHTPSWPAFQLRIGSTLLTKCFVSLLLLN